MNAHTTPSRDRRSHPAIAQIWQFGIPRADSLRIRRRAPNRPLCVVCDTWIPRGNASDGVVMTPAGVPGWHGALRPVRAHPGWIQNSVVAPRLVPGGWLPGWLPNSGHNIENRFVTCAPSRIRTCGLLLRSNPAADAVANWMTQARSGAVRIAVAQVIWSSPAGTPAARPAPRTQHESYRRKWLPAALSSLGNQPRPAASVVGSHSAASPRALTLAAA
jgi:hypothetical protein